MSYERNLASPQHPARKKAREDFNEGEKNNPYNILSNSPKYLAYEDEWKHVSRKER